MSKVSIIVLCHNRWDDTRRCLESLRRHTDPRLYELLVYDNASTDATLENLRRLGQSWPQLRVRRNESNLAFSKGVNRGMREAAGDYFLWLNNDTQLSSGWLEGLLKAVAPRGVAAAGPMTDHMAPLEQVVSRTAFARGPKRVVEAAFLGGFCFLVKREAVLRSGFLDERFVWGWEDMDYCLRLRQAGERLILAQDVFVHHAGSRTIRTIASIERKKTDLSNRRLILSKWRRAEPWRSDFLELYKRMPAPWHSLAPQASIVVVCSAPWRQARAALLSLRSNARDAECEVLAVDGSKDGRLLGSIERLAQTWPELKSVGPWPDLTPVQAANRAAALSQGDFISVMNSSSKPARGWLKRMLQAARSRPDAGASRSKGADGPQGFLSPRRVFERLGGFDERFEGSLGESDYCFRVLQAGHVLVEAQGAIMRGPALASPADRQLALRKWLDIDGRLAGLSERFWTQALAPHGLKPVVSIIFVCRGDDPLDLSSLASVRRFAPAVPYEVVAAALGPKAHRKLRNLSLEWPELRVLGPWTRMRPADAANQTIKATRGAYLLMLSSGVKMTRGTCAGLLRAASAPRVAIAAAACHGTDLVWQRPNPNAGGQARLVKYVRHHCLMIPRDAWIRLGDFDERFRKDLWIEDYCYRADQSGYAILVVDNARVRKFQSGGGALRHDVGIMFHKWSGQPLLPKT